MNSFRSLGGEQGGRLGFLVALGLAVGLLGLSVFAGTASASEVNCGGSVAVDTEHESENSLKYDVKCSEDIRGYSIVSNRSIGYFGTEVIVLAGEEVAEGESFTCEGSIPGSGFGCYGKMTAGNSAQGYMGTTDELCEAPVQPKFWAVALTTQLKKEVPFQLTSEPFQLKFKCDKLDSKQKAKDKMKAVCAKVKLADSKQSRAAAKKRCRDAMKANKAAQKA